MKISFEGAAQTVTGSQTLLDHAGFCALVDCGLYQGPKALRQLNWERPNYLERTKAIILTHAHIDHSGLLPRWAQWGWQGPVYCTPSTADLLEVLLRDAAHLQEEDARYANRTGHSRHKPALPLYTTEDAEAALKLLRVVPFDEWHQLTDGLGFQFLRAGHILGSAVVRFSYKTGVGSSLLTFSGDLGAGHSQILKAPRQVLESDELILESTYGDRKLTVEGREERLAEIVRRVIGRGGTLLIPAFALGRTQDLLHSLYVLQKKGHIPPVPVFLDSPMANRVTAIYRRHMDELQLSAENNHIEEALSTSNFHGIESPEDSMLLTMSTEPKVVLSASGMLNGGRVMHHLKKILPEKNNGILFVGYQSKETKGRLLQDGIMKLRVHHQEVSVEAEVLTLDGYSAHADCDELVQWVKGFSRKPKRIFLNHGEPEGQQTLAERLRRELKVRVEVPQIHQSFHLQD